MAESLGAGRVFLQVHDVAIQTSGWRYITAIFISTPAVSERAGAPLCPSFFILETTQSLRRRSRDKNAEL